MKFSIIVPVYNSSGYLKECLESLHLQSYKNFEVIMVNDGSTDNSESICNDFSLKDDRFILYNNTNHGVSFTRNFGIKKSSGDLLMFVDSDDYISPNTLEVISTKCIKNDIVIFGYSEIYKNCCINKIQNNDISDLNEIKEKVIISNLGGFLCNKVFKKDFIIKYNLLLDDTISYCEDLVFTVKYLNYCKNGFYINKPFYKYRMRKSGVSWSFYKEKNVSIFNAYNAVLNMLSDDNCINNIKLSYVFNYYRLKKFLNYKNDCVNYDIINDYNKGLLLTPFSLKIKIFLCKNSLFLFKFIQRVKQIKYKLFD